MGDRFENWQPDPEWLAGMAEAEERHGSFSVGGLAGDMGPALPRLPEARSAFTRFIDLARRQRKLTLEALAEAADVDLGELVGIMEDHAPPSTRAVYNIASVLEVPTRKLLELSGLADVRDAALAEAAVRFAARSEPTAALTREERRALDEFVKVLVENSDQPA